MAGAEKTYEGVRDMLIREQYYHVSTKDLAVFLRERKPQTIDEVATLAESYLDAHASKSKSFDGGRQGVARNDKRLSQWDHKSKFDGNKHSSQSVSGKEWKKEERKCFICSKPGHIAKDCYQRGNTVKQKVGAVVADDDVSNDQLELKCGCSMPILNACKLNSAVHNMPVVTGHIAGKPVSVLRDTGCSTLVVRRSLVHDKQLTGKVQLCKLIDGTVRRVPCASVYIDTPFYTGQVNAVCMAEPLYDVVVGNIPGVRDSVHKHHACHLGRDSSSVSTVSSVGKHDCSHAMVASDTMRAGSASYCKQCNHSTASNTTRASSALDDKHKCCQSMTASKPYTCK